VTDIANTDLNAAAAAAAVAAAAVLPSGGALTAGEPSNELDASELFGQAVTATVNGSTNGELLIVIGRALATALTESPLGPIDVAQALTPTLQAAAQTLGSVALGTVTTSETRLAVGRFTSDETATIVALLDGGQVGAAVGLRLEATVQDSPGFTPIVSAVSSNEPSPFIPAEISAQRLDLLRGVEMDVTAEIGRTKMTVSELLSLRDGFVVELDRPAGAPADLLVNGHLIARGEVVVIDENFGLRITEIVSDEAGR